MFSVIVLNRNYQYWSEVSLRRALRWMQRNKIDVVLFENELKIKTSRLTLDAPVVVRLQDFVGYKIKYETIPYGPHNVFNRDNNICQYWHYNEDGDPFKYQCSEDDRSIDHVLPTSRGGATDFLNCICCCKEHNHSKRNKTPEEAGLILIRKPFAPVAKKGDMVTNKFVYNPGKIAHKHYMERFLKKEFNHFIFD